MRKLTTIAGGATALVLVLAGCGSNGGGSDTSVAADQSGIDAATEYLASVSSNPTDIGIDTPLSKKPDAGKHIIALVTGEPVAKVKSDAAAAAAAALGWKYEKIAIGATAEGPQQAMEAAIAKRPDGISFSGYPSAAFGNAIQEAADADIPLLADTVTEDASGPLISTSLDNATQVANWGKMVAAQFVVDSKGTGQAASFTMTEYPILVAWQDALQAAVKEWCAACKVTPVATPAADIGTKLPAAVVSTFQRDPNLKYALFSTGDQTLGVAPALSAAGLGSTSVMGETPTEANIEALRAGTESGWTGYPTDILGWRIMDMWARYFNGDDLAPANDALLPLQMITTANIGDVELNDTGTYYVGYTAYEDAFKKLWLVS